MSNTITYEIDTLEKAKAWVIHHTMSGTISEYILTEPAKAVDCNGSILNLYHMESLQVEGTHLPNHLPWKVTRPEECQLAHCMTIEEVKAQLAIHHKESEYLFCFMRELTLDLNANASLIFLLRVARQLTDTILTRVESQFSDDKDESVVSESQTGGT